MHSQLDTNFLRELRSRSDFELFYEFVMWDYDESKNELDIIKGEITKRSSRKNVWKFACLAFLINFSLLLFETVYNDRWEYFETNRKCIYRQVIVGLVSHAILLIVIGMVIYGVNNWIGELIFEVIFLIFILPSVVKTFFDVKNYSK